jgi:hypothetical protein
MKAETKKFIANLVDANKSYSAIESALVTLDHAKDKAEAQKLLADAGVEKGQKKAIIDEMYSFLEEKARTEEELKLWIEQNGTDNTMRWFKTHDKARQLANKIHEKYSK